MKNQSPEFISLVKSLVDSVPSCHCDEAYLSRNLTDPFCPRCNYFDDDEIAKLKEMLKNDKND